MKVLFDTHLLLWAITDDRRLSARVRALLADPANECFYSAASVWEVAIKHRVRPDDIPVTPEQMIRFCRDSGIEELPICFGHAKRVSTLPNYHGDPFDRMLVAQASEENLLLVTHDRKLPPYGDFVAMV